MRTRILTSSHPRDYRHRGVAAIEFALVLTLSIAFFYGIATFGAAIHTQHILTRAAEDGARIVSLFNNATEAQVRAAVLESMSSPWKDVPGLRITAPMTTNPVVVTVIYPYRENALLPSIPLVSGWIPGNLQAHATVAKPSF